MKTQREGRLQSAQLVLGDKDPASPLGRALKKEKDGGEEKKTLYKRLNGLAVTLYF